jgi:hypothetical protein
LKRAVCDGGESDSPTDGDHDEAATAPASSVKAFGYGESLDVVLDKHRYADGSAQMSAERHCRPAEHGSVDVTDVRTFNDPGHTDADSEQPASSRLGKGPHARHEAFHGIWRKGIVRLVASGHHLSVEAHVNEDEVIDGQLDADGSSSGAD